MPIIPNERSEIKLLFNNRPNLASRANSWRPLIKPTVLKTEELASRIFLSAASRNTEWLGHVLYFLPI